MSREPGTGNWGTGEPGNRSRELKLSGATLLLCRSVHFRSGLCTLLHTTQKRGTRLLHGPVSQFPAPASWFLVPVSRFPLPGS